MDWDWEGVLVFLPMLKMTGILVVLVLGVLIRICWQGRDMDNVGVISLFDIVDVLCSILLLISSKTGR